MNRNRLLRVAKKRFLTMLKIKRTIGLYTTNKPMNKNIQTIQNTSVAAKAM